MRRRLRSSSAQPRISLQSDSKAEPCFIEAIRPRWRILSADSSATADSIADLAPAFGVPPASLLLSGPVEVELLVAAQGPTIEGRQRLLGYAQLRWADPRAMGSTTSTPSSWWRTHLAFASHAVTGVNLGFPRLGSQPSHDWGLGKRSAPRPLPAVPRSSSATRGSAPGEDCPAHRAQLGAATPCRPMLPCGRCHGQQVCRPQVFCAWPRSSAGWGCKSNPSNGGVPRCPRLIISPRLPLPLAASILRHGPYFG